MNKLKRIFYKIKKYLLASTGSTLNNAIKAILMGLIFSLILYSSLPSYRIVLGNSVDTFYNTKEGISRYTLANSKIPEFGKGYKLSRQNRNTALLLGLIVSGFLFLHYNNKKGI